MKVLETKLKGCFIIEPKVFKDKRGYFFEIFNKQTFKELTETDVDFLQDNESQSSKGVLRGLHYQSGSHSQAKLVRVVKGKVLDVAVDIRKNSPTYGEHITLEISEDNKKQLFIPRGFAHGFLVLEDETIFSYKCDNLYEKSSEEGILYNDSTLNINWNFPQEELIISEKDSILPNFKDVVLW